MGLDKNLVVNELLQKSKLESFIMGIGGETYENSDVKEVITHGHDKFDVFMKIS